MPARGPVRTVLNAGQVATDPKAGGSSPPERAQVKGHCGLAAAVAAEGVGDWACLLSASAAMVAACRQVMTA
jgi:hypothetical protein